MCGIVGFDFSDKSLLKKMMGAIAHRGPDQDGFFIDDDASLGHKRLSIIDLSAKGKQPMKNSSNTCCIVFNGEIYNFKEIRAKLENLGYNFNSNTDTEVIINAYEEYGVDCVNLFNGDFAFCIYDFVKKNFFLARDRLGIKPLYYFFDQKNFMFASEYKAFLLHDFKREINSNALSKYLSLRYNYGRDTLIKNIHRALPGEYIIYDLKSKKLHHKRFWEASFKPEKVLNNSEEFFAENTKNILKDSVAKRLMSDVPLGVFLSGGIDSASIVALMNSSGVEEINTFSVGFGYGEETDELKFSRMISEKFSTKHNEFIVSSNIAKVLPKIIWHCDEPLADPALLPVYLLSEKTKPKATVILTGDGGDEVFAGYEQNKFMKLASAPYALRRLASPIIKITPKSLLNKFFKYSSKLGSEGQKRAISFLNKKNKLDQYLEIISIFNETELKSIYNNASSFKNELSQFYQDNNNVLNQTLKLEFETQLPENMLHKGDSMTMAFGIESRVPFLDHNLVEFSEKIPPNLKLKGFKEKYILRKAMMPFLPKEIIKRKKQRFYVPIDRWLSNDLKPMVDDLLSTNSLRESGIFKIDAVQNIQNNYSSSPLFYARQLWVLLTFQIWHKEIFSKAF